MEKCFSLYQTAYDIVWTDDEGDKCSIREESDLDEAISYFGSEGAEPPGPSNMSVSSSGRSSSGSRKITIYVDICVDYDGPSLSETSSIASREEFEVGDNQSDWDLSNFSRSELEDDEITVSSKDTGSAPGQRARPFSPSVAAAVSHLDLIILPLHSGTGFIVSIVRSLASHFPFKSPLLRMLNLKETGNLGQISMRAPSNPCP